jgi:hypothetical protein
VREPETRDLPIASQVKGALHLLSCGLALLLVLAGQTVVDLFWPAAAEPYRGATR